MARYLRIAKHSVNDDGDVGGRHRDAGPAAVAIQKLANSSAASGLLRGLSPLAMAWRGQPCGRITSDGSMCQWLGDRHSRDRSSSRS